jgi:F-type H+-transporting ATPase subunit gamma
VSRERTLTRRLRVLGTLGEAVRALRALSAHHFRAARQALGGARLYREEVEATMGALAELVSETAKPVIGPPAIILVTADLGLCGEYVMRLVEAAAAARAELGPGPLYCVGRRAVRPLGRLGIVPDQVYSAPASIAALPHLLLPLVDAVIADRHSANLGTLDLVAARFEGAGHFTPVRVRILPPAPVRPAPAVRPSPYTSRAHLTTVVVREFLYVVLHESLLDALAAEHGKRLTVAESARAWIEERIAATSRLLAAVRREASTQEILEVAAGARLQRQAVEAST